MPGPWQMPSQPAMVLNSTGMPPAAAMPSRTAADSRRRWAWPAVSSLQELTMATRGLRKSASVKPIGR